MKALLIGLLLALATLPARAADDMELSIEIERESVTPYTHEMVMLTIKGAYKLPITLENLEQPDLAGFGWMQLGPDNWFETQDKGRRVVNLERRMALYPERAGEIEIGAFTHHLTLSRPNGERYIRDLVSEPLTITVAPSPTDGEWWFPVSRITVDDNWSNAPQALGRGESALRGVVMTVVGTQPEMIPPMPDLTGTGVAILPHPEKRITQLRPYGPVTRIFWRWTIRPHGDVSGFVDPVELPYYDATSREARTITLSAQRVAFEGASEAAVAEAPPDARTALDAAEKTKALSPVLRAAIAPLFLLGGLCGGVALLGGTLRGRRQQGFAALLHRIIGTPDARALGRAVRRNDASATRAAATRLLGDHPRRAAILAPLDAALYGPGGGAPDLAALLRAVRETGATRVR